MALRKDWAILAQKRRPQVIRPVVARGGYREDLGFYVRSAMEANFCRYLKFLEDHEQLTSWSYESQEWEFPVKRGNRFYKSDFHVKEKNGSEYYVEVKGYMDADSKVKLKRMAKYYPEVKIRVVTSKEMAGIAKIKNLIPHWE